MWGLVGRRDNLCDTSPPLNELPVYNHTFSSKCVASLLIGAVKTAAWLQSIVSASAVMVPKVVNLPEGTFVLSVQLQLFQRNSSTWHLTMECRLGHLRK